MGSKRKRSKQPQLPKLRELNDHEMQKITNLMEELRVEGVDRVVDIPKTVVVGDTSSGKSSVMSRITGIEFPCGEGVVTTFVTEVDMRRKDDESIKYEAISTETDRDGKPKAGGKVRREVLDSESVEQAFYDAAAIMGKRSKQTLMKDILRIEIRGPECPDLTVIDLPGLMQAQIEGVSKEDMDWSTELIKHYIDNERTIILAVVSASHDVVNQKITQMTREVDPEGDRTMGILTKVDLMVGKANDNNLMKVISNEKIRFELGWHALANKIDDDDNASEEQISEAEKKLFASPRFSKLKQGVTGIDALVSRIVTIAGRKRAAQLPAVQRDVETKLQEAKDDLTELGDPRSDVQEQQDFLMKLSKDFEEMIEIEVYFSKPPAGGLANSLKPNLQTDIQILQNDFARAMRHYGSFVRFDSNPNVRDIMALSNVYRSWNNIQEVKSVPEAIQWVMMEQAASGIHGLPGLMEVRVTAQLLQKLSQRWESLTVEHIQRIGRRCEDGVMRILSTVTKNDVVKKIMTTWVKPHVDEEVKKARADVEELSKSKLSFLTTEHPRLRDLTHDYYDAAAKSLWGGQRVLVPDQLEESIAANALCGVRAFYDLQLEYWVTAVGKQIVEGVLCRLPEVLTSDRVEAASSEEIKKLVSEPKDALKKREKLQKRVVLLEGSLNKIDTVMRSLCV